MQTNQSSSTVQVDRGERTVLDAAEAALDAYTRQANPGGGFEDPGPLVVAAMLAEAAPPGAPRPVPEAVVAWLSRCKGSTYYANLGVTGGMAGFVLGLQRAALTWPEFGRIAATMRTRLVEAAAELPWRRDQVGWNDYDLISGPSGTLAVLAADPTCVTEECAPLVEHLVWLCDGADLPRLRVGQYQDEELRRFNHGRINAGIGHGVPGVVAGLRAAADAGALSAAGFDALRRTADWVVRQSFVDSRGVQSWGSLGLHDDADLRAKLAGHASRRQAWCYGNPGITWALWEAGRVLEDQALMEFASAAAGSFLAVYDDDAYLDHKYPDRIGICHGAAGLLLVFDAFDRYAGLPGAARLRDHLAHFLQERLDELVVGTETSMSLLAGVPGAIASLLSYRRADDRQWLSGFGLR